MAPQAVSNSTTTSTYSVVAQLKGGLLLLVSLLILLALLGIGNGWINELIANALRGLVGWGAYPITILLGFLGLQLLLPYRWHRQVKPGRILSMELLTLCFFALAELLNNPQLEWALAASGVGGGRGWLNYCHSGFTCGHKWRHGLIGIAHCHALAFSLWLFLKPDRR
jgi:hypothetical protein